MLPASILHAAIYDAVVSITQDAPAYLFSVPVPSTARADAAAAQAGHDALVALYPKWKAALDLQLAAEVKSLGQNTSTTRTADQTVIAKFWAGPIWNTWNEIAENAALAHHTNLESTPVCGAQPVLRRQHHRLL